MSQESTSPVDVVRIYAEANAGAKFVAWREQARGAA
jgi:hypothetical protein